MKPNYGAAAIRHFKDAKCLKDKHRSHLPGADHLFGLATECALKRILEKNGLLTLTPDGKPEQPNLRGTHGHPPDVWDECLSYQGKNRALPVLPTTNPFFGWDISDRYSNGSSITDAMATAHHDAARAALNAMQGS